MPDGNSVVTEVTVKIEPSLPVVVDSCVRVAVVCDWAVVGDEELALDDIVGAPSEVECVLWTVLAGAVTTTRAVILVTDFGVGKSK